MILSLWLPDKSIKWSKQHSLKEKPTFPSGKERRRKLTMLLCQHRIFPYGFVAAAALVLSNGRAGPFVTAAQGECNDSIKPQSIVVSASGWCIDRAPVRRRRTRGKGVEVWSDGWMCTHIHTQTRPDTIFSLIYSRSALMSSWLRPQLPSAEDLATVLMKEQGYFTHTHTRRQHDLQTRPESQWTELLIKATLI